MTLTAILITVSAIFMAASLVFCIVPRGWCAMLAFAAMCVAICVPGSALTSAQLWFWGAASLMVLGLSLLLPAPVARSRHGVGYVVTATLAGLLVGLLISPAAMVLGGVAGAFCGTLAFSRTPAGRRLDFPSAAFVNYLCAKGLPPVITLSADAVTILSLCAPAQINLFT